MPFTFKKYLYNTKKMDNQYSIFRFKFTNTKFIIRSVSEKCTFPPKNFGLDDLTMKMKKKKKNKFKAKCTWGQTIKSFNPGIWYDLQQIILNHPKLFGFNFANKWKQQVQLIDFDEMYKMYIMYKISEMFDFKNGLYINSEIPNGARMQLHNVD